MGAYSIGLDVAYVSVGYIGPFNCCVAASWYLQAGQAVEAAEQVGSMTWLFKGTKISRSRGQPQSLKAP